MSISVDGFVRLAEVDVERRRVFVRADLDCPVDEHGAIADDSKLRAAMPTLRQLLDREAQVVVGAHLSGAPLASAAPAPPPAEGKRFQDSEESEAVSTRSLEPCAARLAELLATEVYLPDQCTGLLAQKLVSELRPGKLVLLANLLGDPREAAGDAALARELTSGVEVFVGDCLAGPHSLSSLTQAPRFVRERALGARLEQELVFVNRLRHEWGRGLALLIGGSFGAYRSLLNLALSRPGVTVVAQGRLARSLSDTPADVEVDGDDPAERLEARSWLQKARTRGVRVEIAPNLDGVDRIAPLLERAKSTLVLGWSPADATAKQLLSAALRGSGVLAAVGGPSRDISSLLEQPGLLRTCFVSTAGQSFVSLLCEQKLAGVEALRRVG